MMSLRPVSLMLPVVAAVVLSIAVPGYAPNAATSKFDQNPTGFPLTGTHVSVPCASCHINARYKTTPRACFGCHNGMTAPGAASVLSHPVTTNYCEGCHQTTTWRDYRFIDHVQALGPCANCHNNKIAAGKTPNHPITNAACNTCHFNTVTGWFGDRKSTRLNSSHANISYAVFCLKKKKIASMQHLNPSTYRSSI